MSETDPQYKTFAPFTDEELCALEDAHRRIERVRGATPPARPWRKGDAPEPPWEVVFRAPTPAECEFFELHTAGNEKQKASALRNHTKATVVGVSIGGRHVVALDRNDARAVEAVRSAWEEVRKVDGGLVHIATQDAVMRLAGMVQDEEGKG